MSVHGKDLVDVSILAGGSSFGWFREASETFSEGKWCCSLRKLQTSSDLREGAVLRGEGCVVCVCVPGPFCDGGNKEGGRKRKGGKAIFKDHGSEVVSFLIFEMK